MRSPSAGAARRRVVFLCGIIPVLITAVLALYRPTILARLDNAVYDSLLRSARTQPPGDRIIIVDIDERSLSAIGQWPWRGDLIGRLIEALAGLVGAERGRGDRMH